MCDVILYICGYTIHTHITIQRFPLAIIIFSQTFFIVISLLLLRCYVRDINNIIYNIIRQLQLKIYNVRVIHSGIHELMGKRKRRVRRRHRCYGSTTVEEVSLLCFRFILKRQVEQRLRPELKTLDDNAFSGRIPFSLAVS